MNIIIIRPGAIGDTLLTFPILHALRTRYTNPHITFVGNAAVLPLALEVGIADAISDYHSLEWSDLFSPAGIRTPVLRVLLGQTDLAICWLRDADHLIEYNLREAGVRQSIVAPGRPPEGERIHIVDYLAGTIEIECTPGTLVIDEECNQYKRGDTSSGGIAIHPGSGGKQKCWPVERFAEVIERIWQRGWPVLLLGGPADREQLAYLQRRLTPPRPELLSLLVNAPLTEVAKQLRQRRCYLGNDSGITHLAALLGLPTLALFGASDPAVWHPVGPDSRLIQVIYEPDLAQLPVDTVVARVFTPNYLYN
jgi:heptosyltransferase III